MPPPLILAGTAVLLLGGAGDLAYHLLGAETLVNLAPLVGDDGYRAHLITFAGMLISVTGLLVRAAQTRGPTRRRHTTFPKERKNSRKCPSVPS